MDRPDTSKGSFSDAWSAQRAVLKALLLRELTARFGRDNIGILWLIGEPLMLASVISIMHLIMGGHATKGSVQPGMFTLVGYTCFIIFRGLFNRAGGMVESSMQLLYHRNVTILDMLLVKVVIEVAGCFSAYLILMSVFVALGMADWPARPIYVLMGFGMMGWLTAAASMVVANVTFGRPTLERLTHTFSYFMMPISGAFFMVEWLPSDYQDIIIWNPLTCIFEITRYGQFETASGDFVFPGYVVCVNAFLTYSGLVMLRQVRLKLHFT